MAGWRSLLNHHQGEKMAKVGDRIGKWTLRRRLGRGGQGEVFSASEGEGAEAVAIKVIRATRAKARARFLQEIQTHAALSSQNAPNVVRLINHNLSELNDNETVEGFLVMPLAIGNLEDQIPVLRGRYELCLELFEGIVNGIAQGHRAEIIHRDIKPANILFTDPSLREPLVSDFGICLLRDTPDHERLTDAGETVGAKYFMAPEQERGGRADVTPAADVYALGKLLHHMLTGRYIYREQLEDIFETEEVEAEPRTTPCA